MDGGKIILGLGKGMIYWVDYERRGGNFRKGIGLVLTRIKLFKVLYLFNESIIHGT